MQPLHGDYHSGNLLARNGRIIALIDWDEAVLGVPEFELAAAALEFGDDLVRDLAPARAFLAAYRAEGGPAEIAEDEALTQLIRHKLRREAAYFELAARRGAVHTAEQVDYHRARVQAFHDLSL
ncbi:phosphotransferase [Kutzneria viridogrisea]|uniref:phosphotransferase n=1 Tax=Kutzneria viridogrisea TaxID=47990 RepID=UPI00398D1641